MRSQNKWLPKWWNEISGLRQRLSPLWTSADSQTRRLAKVQHSSSMHLSTSKSASVVSDKFDKLFWGKKEGKYVLLLLHWANENGPVAKKFFASLLNNWWQWPTYVGQIQPLRAGSHFSVRSIGICPTDHKIECVCFWVNNSWKVLGSPNITNTMKIVDGGQKRQTGEQNSLYCFGPSIVTAQWEKKCYNQQCAYTHTHTHPHWGLRRFLGKHPGRLQYVFIFKYCVRLLLFAQCSHKEEDIRNIVCNDSHSLSCMTQYVWTRLVIWTLALLSKCFFFCCKELWGMSTEQTMQGKNVLSVNASVCLWAQGNFFSCVFATLIRNKDVKRRGDDIEKHNMRRTDVGQRRRHMHQV